MSYEFNKSFIIKPEFYTNENFSTNLGELRAEYLYTYNISAITVNQYGEEFQGKNATLERIYPPGSKN